MTFDISAIPLQKSTLMDEPVAEIVQLGEYSFDQK
jgi:hypothetical protein